MLPLYIGAFTLGGVLIAASILLGDADHDADFDADMDVDADMDADADAEIDHHFEIDHHLPNDLDADTDIDGNFKLWLPFLSMRFWTFALASFGASGLLLNLMQITAVIGLVVSCLLGLFMGWSVAWMFHTLKRATVSSEITTHALQGNEATAMLSISPEKAGKIRLSFDGNMLDLTARTQDNETIARGDKVLIVSFDNGIAQVTRLRGLNTVTNRQPVRQPQER